MTLRKAMRCCSTFTFLAILTGCFVFVPSAKGQVSGFVTRSGNTLQLNGSTFRYAGANIYWLGVDQNSGCECYPSNFRTYDALYTVAQMGGNVVRSTTMGVSVGKDYSIETSLNNFNDNAFAPIDYAIATASKLGIRFIIPLIDNYQYYAGGKYIFTGWRGISDENQFFTDSTVIADYEAYINHILNHVNTITGIALKNDPAIMAWETGNEIFPPTAWTSTISAYIKSIDSNHLVLDGHYGVDTGALSLSTVDLVGAHFNNTRYKMTAAALSSQVALANGQRPFIVGEFAWNNHNGGGDLTGFLSAVQSTSAVPGATYWSLFGHLDSFGYEQHGDGLTLHFPGDDSTMQGLAQQLRNFAFGIRGMSVPAYGTPDGPLITYADNSANVQWRGAIGAGTYQLERSTSGATGPWTVLTSSATDNNLPYVDTGHPSGGAWYRVKGRNPSSVYTRYSGIYWNGTGTQLTTDLLNDWTYVAAHGDNLAFDSTNSSYFQGDTSRVRRTVDDTESFYYVINGLTSLQFTVYTKSTASVLSTVMRLSGSSDGGVTYNNLSYSLGTGFSGGGGGWTGYNVAVTVPAGTNTFKITLYSGTGYSYDPEISSVTFGQSRAEMDDLFNDWTKVSGYTTNLSFDGTNTAYFLGDSSRVRRTVDDTESLYYLVSGLNAVRFRVFSKVDTKTLGKSLLLSATTDNGVNFLPVHFVLDHALATGGGGWTGYDVTVNDLPPNANGFKITLAPGTGYSYDPEISNITLISTP